MKPRILLVNPPVYDFTAYDFWAKPYGLVRVGGMLADHAELTLFDYMNRNFCDPTATAVNNDRFNRGKYFAERIPKPQVFKDIPRYFHRFGIKRSIFQKQLEQMQCPDAVLIQSSMTYWYPGIQEVIKDIRHFCPGAKIIIGGTYATICLEHVAGIGADMIVRGSELEPMFEMLGIAIDHKHYSSPYWQGYSTLNSAVMTLTTGCPFKCTYCYNSIKTQSTSRLAFCTRPLEHCVEDLNKLIETGVQDIAFYDDALLYKPEQVFIPFLKYVIDNKIRINFHTPNALHCKFLDREIAELMVKAGFKTFYLGFESSSDKFHSSTGSKVSSDELEKAVDAIRYAQHDISNVTAYEMLGHPFSDQQHLRETMEYVNSLGIRIMLSDFSPIPGTIDGDGCSAYTDLGEPLNHNKTAFPIRFLGNDKVNFYKSLCKQLNRQLNN